MPDPIAELTKMIGQWAYDPVSFVEDAIGVKESTRPGMHVTEQQKQGLQALGDLVRIKEKRGRKEKLTEKELELVLKVGVSIRGGRGPGKTTVKSWAVIWFMSCFPYPRIVCTGANADVVKNNLFSEVNKWLNLQDQDGNYTCLVRDMIEVQERRIIWKGMPKENIGKRWFAEIRTVHPQKVNKEDAATLGGAHEDYVLAIAVEASGTPDFVWTPVEGGLTGMVNIALLGWNPTRRKGFAYKSHFGDTKNDWIKLHWDAEDSPLVTAESREKNARRGKDSNYYRIHVKGLPPMAESDTIIPYEMAEAAQEADIEHGIEGREIIPDMYDPIVGGLDCAMGGDEAVLIIRHGGKMTAMYTWPDIHDTSELAFKALQKLWEHGFDVCYVDNIGLGAGVYSQMRLLAPEEKEKIVGVKVSESASRDDKYYRLRDEMIWRVRGLFEQGLISIIRDELLVDQISDPKQDNDEQYTGKFKAESKRKMKSRGRGSPDRFDALVLTYYRSDTYLRSRKKRSRSSRSGSRRDKREPAFAGTTWMSN